MARATAPIVIIALALVSGPSHAFHSTIAVLPTGKSAVPNLISMARYEDADDRRLSQGGSGGRFGKTAKRAVGVSRFGEGDNNIRRQKLEEYVNSEEEAADPLIGKIIAGSLLVTLFSLLFGVYAYYGADGLEAATQSQRSIRGM